VTIRNTPLFALRFAHCGRTVIAFATPPKTSASFGMSPLVRQLPEAGYGLSIAVIDQKAKLLERLFEFLPDGEATHREWRRLLVAHSVSGVQVHDATLVAAMTVHGVTNLLTLNPPDFRRYSSITAVHSSEIVASR
jgi:predicted nucleic acid-binding protein